MKHYSVDEILSKDQQRRLTDAINLHPLGSEQLVEIAELSAKLACWGVWAKDVLKKEIERRGIK